MLHNRTHREAKEWQVTVAPTGLRWFKLRLACDKQSTAKHQRCFSKVQQAETVYL
jgi:hypothetical protein